MKIEQFDRNGHHYFLEEKGKACKLKNTIPNVIHTDDSMGDSPSYFAARGIRAFHKIGTIVKKENYFSWKYWSNI